MAEDYEWGITPEQFRREFVVSVALELSREDVAEIVASASKEIEQ